MPRQAGEELISAGASSGVCPASGVVWWPNTLSDLGLPATGPSSGPSRYRQIQWNLRSMIACCSYDACGHNWVLRR